MTIKSIEVEFSVGPIPAAPSASEIALEAGVTEAMAGAYIAAAWEQAETFCGRCWRGITVGEVLIEVDELTEWRWPRYPYPAAIMSEVWSDELRGWQARSIEYRAGWLMLYPGNLYRLTQSPTAPVDPLPSHVVQAVANLALYQLIQLPTRREFKSQTQGDTTLSREALMGIFYGSGAGALLASEVRK